MSFFTSSHMSSRTSGRSAFLPFWNGRRRRTWRSTITPASVHGSPSSLRSCEAQKRYAEGIRDCVGRFLEGRPLEKDYLIVDGGKVVSPSYSYAY